MKGRCIEIYGKFYSMHLTQFNYFSLRIVEFFAAMLATLCGKNKPRSVRLPIKWAVVLQQTFLWRLLVKVCIFFFYYYYMSKIQACHCLLLKYILFLG